MGYNIMQLQLELAEMRYVSMGRHRRHPLSVFFGIEEVGHRQR